VKIYRKLVINSETLERLFESAYEYSGIIAKAAGGMLTKQAEFLTPGNRFLNSTNDATSGGQIVSLPTGVTGPAVSQTIPGDRIVLDDATAAALSNTTVGTLYGGVYMYVGTLATATQAPRRGGIAFWRSNELPGGATLGYTCTSDAQPTAAIPSYIAGVFINSITAGNFGWIQVAGTASVLYDSSVTAAATGISVSAKVSASLPATADAGVALSITTLAFQLGVAIGSPVSSTISSVIITRGLFCGRI
jgi:hypothetical protein